MWQRIKPELDQRVPAGGKQNGEEDESIHLE